MNWISVNDRLPEIGETVLLYVLYRKNFPYNSINEIPFVGLLHSIDIDGAKFVFLKHSNGGRAIRYSYNKDGKIEFVYSEKDKKSSGLRVTHWMPLPESPK